MRAAAERVIVFGNRIMPSDRRFSVLAEKKGYDKPLYSCGLSFEKLVDEIVVPYEREEAFFIDGVPVRKSELNKVKIIEEAEDFSAVFDRIHNLVQLSPSAGKHIGQQEYQLRLDALFRNSGHDVTNQIIRAYEVTIGTRLKEYVPKREELISAALQVFSQYTRYVGGGG